LQVKGKREGTRKPCSCRTQPQKT